MLGKFEVPEQPVAFGAGSIRIADNRASIPIGTLKGFQAVGL